MNTAIINSILLLFIALPLGAGCTPDAEIGSPSAGDLKSGSVVVLTDASFDREVIGSSQPVLVDFWAAWCSPCLELKPAIRELAREYTGRAKVAELDVSENRFTAEKYGVHELPALLLFQDGEVVERLDGRQTKAELTRLLESRLLPAEPPGNGEIEEGS